MNKSRTFIDKPGQLGIDEALIKIANTLDELKIRTEYRVINMKLAEKKPPGDIFVEIVNYIHAVGLGRRLHKLNKEMINREIEKYLFDDRYFKLLYDVDYKEPAVVFYGEEIERDFKDYVTPYEVRVAHIDRVFYKDQEYFVLHGETVM